MRCLKESRSCSSKSESAQSDISKGPSDLSLPRVRGRKKGVRWSSNSRILHEGRVTLLDGLFDDPLSPKGAHLKHLLKTDDIIVLDDFHDLDETFLFVVVEVGLDGRRTQEDVVSEQPDPFP